MTKYNAVMCYDKILVNVAPYVIPGYVWVCVWFGVNIYKNIKVTGQRFFTAKATYGDHRSDEIDSALKNICIDLMSLIILTYAPHM
jgi:hypothetical protein